MSHPWSLLAILLAIAITAAWQLTRPAAAATSLTRFARRVDLAVIDEVHDDALRRVQRRDAAGLVGAATGLAAVLVAWLATGADEPGTAGPLTVFGAVLAGLAAARAGVALRESTTSDPLAPRIARAVHLRLRDYVQPLELTGARAVVGVAALLVAAVHALAAADVLDPHALHLGQATGFTLAALVSLALAELVGRRIVSRPQHASTSLELAWDDALRAMTLRDLVTVPLSLGTWAAFLTVFAGADAATESSRHLVNGICSALLGAAVLGAVVVATISTAQRPARHFRTRLWPTPPTPPAAAASTPVGATPVGPVGTDERSADEVAQ